MAKFNYLVKERFNNRSPSIDKKQSLLLGFFTQFQVIFDTSFVQFYQNKKTSLSKFTNNL